MEIKLLLEPKKLIRINDAVIAGERCVIAFDSKIYELGKLGVTLITKGREKHTFLLEGTNILDITDFCKQAGRIDIVVELIMRGRTIKSWECEPIIVRELNGEFELIPEIVAMRRELALMKQVLKEFNQKINETI